MRAPLPLPLQFVHDTMYIYRIYCYYNCTHLYVLTAHDDGDGGVKLDLEPFGVSESGGRDCHKLNDRGSATLLRSLPFRFLFLFPFFLLLCALRVFNFGPNHRINIQQIPVEIGQSKYYRYHFQSRELQFQ